MVHQRFSIRMVAEGWGGHSTQGGGLLARAQQMASSMAELFEGEPGERREMQGAGTVLAQAATAKRRSWRA